VPGRLLYFLLAAILPAATDPTPRCWPGLPFKKQESAWLAIRLAKRRRIWEPRDRLLVCLVWRALPANFEVFHLRRGLQLLATHHTSDVIDHFQPGVLFRLLIPTSPAVGAVETPLGNAGPLRARAARGPLSLLRRRVTPAPGRHQSLMLNLCTTRWILSILVIYWQFCYADGVALTDLICATARLSGPRRRNI
jgi:hypothetical protein